MELEYFHEMPLSVHFIISFYKERHVEGCEKVTLPTRGETGKAVQLTSNIGLALSCIDKM